MKESVTFSFGKNWDLYLKTSFNEKRLKKAESSLVRYLGMKSLKGKTFMDIGCGSGLFSLCAKRLGAKKIISFDVDPFSVACCKKLKEKFGKGTDWSVAHGSVLDEKYMKTLPQADIVYSWGVLHHTGKMWKAIDNASKKVKKGGIFYIAIYNKKLGFRGSKDQLRLKRFYNKSPKIVKKSLEYATVGSYFFKNMLCLRNPWKMIKDREKHSFSRGMTFYVDIIDWLGGLPYEAAKPQEIFDFVAKDRGFQLIDCQLVDERNALGNNQFVFVKK